MEKHYDNTLGAEFIGCLFTSVMYGITCIQMFTFIQNSSKDRNVVKCAVACLFVLDTVHFIFVAHALYWYSVTNYNSPDALKRIPWSIAGMLIVTAMSDGIVRCFFTYRIWVLSHKKRFITYPLIGLIMMIFALATAFGIKSLTLATYDQIAKIFWIKYISLAALVTTDAFIAGVLCYFLYRERSGFRKTDSMINVLLLYTVNTGMLTSVFALACFITYAALRTKFNYVFLGIYLPLSKLYFNALLASLNARGHISRGLEDAHGSVPFASHTRPNQEIIPIEFAPPASTVLRIFVEREEFKTTSESE